MEIKHLLEKKDTYRGLEYFVIHHYFSKLTHHRCGYIITNRTMVDKLGLDTIDCHGGITFCGWRINYTKLGDRKTVDSFNDRDVTHEVHNDLIFIGFDCAHGEDLFNPKSLDFCIDQCKHIIDQLVI